MTHQTISQSDFNLIKNFQKIVRYEFYLKLSELYPNVSDVDEILGFNEVRKNVFKLSDNREELMANKKILMDNLEVVFDQVRICSINFSFLVEFQLSVCWIAGRQENKLQKVNFRSKVSATEELHGSNWFQLRRFSQHSFFIFRKSKETFRRTGKLQDGSEIQKNRFSFDEFHYWRFPFTPKSNSSVFTENFHRFFRELQWENFRDCPRANFEVLQQYVLLFLQMWSAEFDHLRIDWALYTRWVFWGLEIVIK